MHFNRPHLFNRCGLHNKTILTNLLKGMIMTSAINLSKQVSTGARINLQKSDGSDLKKFCVGANWGAIKSFLGAKAVDLDISLGLFDESGKLLNIVYFGNKSAPGIEHQGDDRSGDVNGDDGLDNEVISVDIDRIDSRVKHIAIILNSYSQTKFNDIPFASARIYQGSESKVEEVLAYYEVANSEKFKGSLGVIMGSIYKHNDKWKFKAIGQATSDRDIDGLLRRYKEEHM